MRLVGGSFAGVGLLAISYGVGVHAGEKHEGGHKKHSYGVGYVEEGGVVGYSCHEGWVPQGEGPGMVCVQKVKTGLLPVCPAGILEGHQCIISEPAMFSCPPGYIEVGGYGGKKDHGHGGKKHHGGNDPLCMQVERAPLVPYCPNGANLQNGQCSRAEIAPATMICPLEMGGGHKHHEGGKKKGHYAAPACVETIDVPALLTCAPGLELQGAMCLGSGQGPCPPTLPPPVLLDSKKGGHHGHGRGLAMIETAPMRELGKKHDKHNEYAAPILAPVPSKVKMCTLEIIEPAVPVCPPGSFESGNMGHHHKDKKKSHGGYMSAGLRCAQTIDVPLEPYCPMPNAILDAKTMTCQSLTNEQALTRCPAGFEPCDSGKKDHGGKKHGGKKHGGKHGGYMSPDCCLANYAPPLPGCPLGAQLLGGECIIVHEPLFECPPGAIRDGEWCYIITTKAPKIHYQINVTTKQAAPIIEHEKKHKHKKHH